MQIPEFKGPMTRREAFLITLISTIGSMLTVTTADALRPEAHAPVPPLESATGNDEAEPFQLAF